MQCEYLKYMLFVTASAALFYFQVLLNSAQLIIAYSVDYYRLIDAHCSFQLCKELFPSTLDRQCIMFFFCSTCIGSAISCFGSRSVVAGRVSRRSGLAVGPRISSVIFPPATGPRPNLELISLALDAWIASAKAQIPCLAICFCPGDRLDRFRLDRAGLLLSWHTRFTMVSDFCPSLPSYSKVWWFINWYLKHATRRTTSLIRSSCWEVFPMQPMSFIVGHAKFSNLRDAHALFFQTKDYFRTNNHDTDISTSLLHYDHAQFFVTLSSKSLGVPTKLRSRDLIS